MAAVTERPPSRVDAGVEDHARACLAGDAEAFGLLYDALVGDAKRVLVGMRLGLDGHEVEDLLQEAFLRLYRSLARLNLDRPLRPYLLGVVRNLGIDRWRLKGRREGRETALGDEPAGGAPADLAAGKAEWGRQVEAALAALDAEQRSVLVLRHTGGLTLVDLAEVLGCSRPTARARLKEAALMLSVELRARGIGISPEEEAA